MSVVGLLVCNYYCGMMQVLRTVPWDRVTIQVVCVEHRHVPEGGQALKFFLQERGYALHSALGDDFIFVRKDLSERPREGLL